MKISNHDVNLNSSNYINAVFNYAPISIFLYNNQGFLQHINPYAKSIFGFTDNSKISQINLFDNPRINRAKIELLNKGESFRVQSVINFDVIKKLELYNPSRSGIIHVDLTITSLGADGYILHIIDIDNLKEKESSNQIYAAIVAVSEDMMAFVDTNYIYKAVNESYRKIFDKPLEQIIGHSILELFGEDYFENVAKPYIQKCLGGENINFKRWINFPSAGLTYWDVNYYPFLNEENIVEGIVINARNITAQHNADEKLRKSELKFKTVANNTFDWEFWLAPDGSSIYHSPSCKRITGYDAEEFLINREKLLGIVLEEDKNKVKLYNKYSLAIDRPQFIEFRIIKKDLSLVWIEQACQPVFDDNNNYIGLRGSNRDITSRKKVEIALIESEEYFKRTFDLAPIGAAIASMDYKFLRVNEMLCKITGYDKEELLSLGFPDITYKDDLEIDIKQAKALLKGKINQYSMEKRYIRKNGEIIWINLSVRLINDFEGRPLYFLPMMENINDRKISEQKLYFSEMRYRNLIENAPVGVAVTKENKILFANETLAKILGLNNIDEIKSKPILHYVYPADKIKISEILLRHKNSPKIEPYSHQFRVLNPDGKVKYLKNFITEFNENETRYFQSIVMDITEEVNSEKQKKRLVSEYLSISKKNKLVSKLKEVTQKNIHKYSFSQKDIKEIEKIFDSIINAEKDWKIIKLHFEELYGDFLSKLKKDFPSLTQIELRHCAYIKLKLTTKEIANLNNVKDTSIQKARVRLKKKLNLNKDDSLFNFLELY